MQTRVGVDFPPTHADQARDVRSEACGQRADEGLGMGHHMVVEGCQHHLPQLRVGHHQLHALHMVHQVSWTDQWEADQAYQGRCVLRHAGVLPQPLPGDVEDVDLTQAQLLAVEAVPHLVVGEQVESALLGNLHQVLGDEHVDLLQGIVHAVQFGCVDKIVKVGRGHAAQKVALAKLYDWGDLEVRGCSNDIKDVVTIQGGGGGVDDLQGLLKALGCDALQLNLFLVALSHPAGEHGAKVVRTGSKDHTVGSKTISCNAKMKTSVSEVYCQVFS